MRRSATIIQAYWRGMVTRIALTKWRLIRKRAAVNIQASVRGWIVRRNPAIQEALAHARLRKHAAATKIQALWRGAIARSRYRDVLLDALADRRSAAHGVRIESKRLWDANAALTHVVASDHRDLVNFVSCSPSLDMAHAKLSVVPQMDADDFEPSKIKKVTMRPQSAPLRKLNDSALSSKTQNRLQRARVLIQDLPSLEQGLDGHLNRLRSHCLVNKSTAVIFYGPQNTFQGDLKSTGVQSPWSCPRREKQWTTWDPKAAAKAKKRPPRPLKKKPEPNLVEPPPAPKRMGGGFVLPTKKTITSASGQPLPPSRTIVRSATPSALPGCR